MKKYIAVLAVIVAVGFISYKVGKYKRDMAGYGHAAEWGCYQGARRACEHFETEQEVYACEEDALEFCPKAGEAFKKFMEQGKRR